MLTPDELRAIAADLRDVSRVVWRDSVYLDEDSPVGRLCNLATAASDVLALHAELLAGGWLVPMPATTSAPPDPPRRIPDCQACSGSGIAPPDQGVNPPPCPACQGTGRRLPATILRNVAVQHLSLVGPVTLDGTLTVADDAPTSVTLHNAHGDRVVEFDDCADALADDVAAVVTSPDVVWLGDEANGAGPNPATLLDQCAAVRRDPDGAMLRCVLAHAHIPGVAHAFVPDTTAQLPPHVPILPDATVTAMAVPPAEPEPDRATPRSAQARRVARTTADRTVGALAATDATRTRPRPPKARLVAVGDPAPDAQCPAVWPESTDGDERCTKPEGHPGAHRADGIAWTDEPATR